MYPLVIILSEPATQLTMIFFMGNITMQHADAAVVV